MNYNLEKKVCRLFHVLVQFLYTASETEVDHYQQKMNVTSYELLLEGRTFHRKVLSQLYLNSKFNILVNFTFVLSIS